MTPCFAPSFAFADFLEGIFVDWLASVPDESFRLAVTNFVEGIFFFVVENLLDGNFAMRFFFWLRAGPLSV